MAIDFRINGKGVRSEAPADTPLLWVIREQLKLTGTKFGCGAGLCGACMVHIDGERAFSCQTQISQFGGLDERISVFLTVVEAGVSPAPWSRLMPVIHGFDLQRCSGRHARTATAARLSPNDALRREEAGDHAVLDHHQSSAFRYGGCRSRLRPCRADDARRDHRRLTYGATTIAGGDGSRQPTANELRGARYQGRKIAETANKLHG